MQNTIDVLPVEFGPAQVQPIKKAGGAHEGSGFSEAIGSAVDRATQQPLNETQNNTKEKTQPMENVKEDDADARMADDSAASGSLNIQQIMAGLIIGIEQENEVVDTAEQPTEQPIQLDNRPVVDVLEGIQTQGGEQEMPVLPTDYESGEPAKVATEQPDDAEAWMPTDSSEAKAPQTTDEIKPQQNPRQPMDVGKEIEGRLEEHLRPLENDNPPVDIQEPTGDMEIFDTKEIEIDIKTIKEDQKSIDDIQGDNTAPIPVVVEETETPHSPTDDKGEDDGQDAPEQKLDADQPKAEAPKQNEAFAVKQDIQPQKASIDTKAQQVEETIFNRMVEDISTNAQQGKHEFSINLRPDFMGDMNIELVMTEAGLTAKIKAADPQVNSIISQHLFKLEQSLKEQGIDVVNLEVSVFDTGEFGKEDFSRQHSRQDGESNAKANRIGRVRAVAREAIMAAGMETLSESQTVEALGMGSSVEYTA